VLSLTPSRMGIITLRRTKSKLAVTGSNFSGISDGSSGYLGCAGGGGAAAA